jgi:hypothetical protein
MVMSKRIVFLLAVVLAVALSLPLPVIAEQGLSSGVLSCLDNGDEVKCKRKMLMNVEVSYGIRALLDVVYVDTAGDINHVSENPLSPAIRFEIIKDKPKYVYPMRYLHMVPYNPYEEVRKIPNSEAGVSSCIDAAVENPSCGWTLNAAGNKIPYSQGFCNNRELSFLETYRPDSSLWRGEEILGSRSTLTNSFSIAHCLKQGPVFYDGYEIDPPRRSYNINTKVMSGINLWHDIIVSPDAPEHFIKAGPIQGQHDVSLKLIGEAAPLIAPPDLSNYILYVPVSPLDHPLVQDWKNNILLVPREMVTADGSECNKVGVSFEAFRNQIASLTEAGDCLANQLYNLHQEDLALLTSNPNAETKYLLSGKKKPRLSSDRLSLVAESPEISYSTVAIILDQPANIASVTHDAIGYTATAYVKDFTSMSKNGTLVAVVANGGKVRGDFIVGVTRCQPDIVGAIPSKAVTLDPNESTELSFDIATSMNRDDNHYCWVELRSSSGKSYDEVQVFFDTKKHESIYARDLHHRNEQNKAAQ